MHNEEIRVVQFPHPGSEHQPDPDGSKAWNPLSCKHARKFLQQRGRYVDALDAVPVTNDLHFWAEWEPESSLIRSLPNSPPLPQFLFHPILKPKRTYRNLHNTDPFVFGDTFYYSNCKLTGQMRELARGSIILFGSNRDGEFILDTVFVVGDRLERTQANYKSLRVPTEFKEATLEPLYAEHSDCERGCADECPDNSADSPLYLCAMQSKPFEGMFSFFPCLPAPSSTGFARPTIPESHFVNAKKAMGLKINNCSLDDARAFWRSIATQVLSTRVNDDHLRLGVFADLPQRVQQRASAENNLPAVR